MTQPAPAAAWYSDPWSSDATGVTGALRWWDGAAWTSHVHPAVPEQPVSVAAAATMAAEPVLRLPIAGDATQGELDAILRDASAWGPFPDATDAAPGIPPPPARRYHSLGRRAVAATLVPMVPYALFQLLPIELSLYTLPLGLLIAMVILGQPSRPEGQLMRPRLACLGLALEERTTPIATGELPLGVRTPARGTGMGVLVSELARGRGCSAAELVLREATYETPKQEDTTLTTVTTAEFELPTLVADRFAGVAVTWRDRRLPGTVMGSAADGPTGWAPVPLEHAGRWTVFAAPDQDPIAVRELLSPVMLLQLDELGRLAPATASHAVDGDLVEQPHEDLSGQGLHIEQRGRRLGISIEAGLLSALDGPEPGTGGEQTAALVRFVELALRVHRRFIEEHR